MRAASKLSFVAKRHFAANSRTFLSKKSVDIIGVPFAGGQPKGGVDQAPEILRPRIAAAISELGWMVEDIGNLALPPRPAAHENDVFDRVKNPEWVGAATKVVADAVHDATKRGHFPLVIGGDHSIAVGSIAGACRAYPDLGVLWVDAHADINTSGTSPSGNLHGMPLSFLLGLTRPVPGFEWVDLDKPCLTTDQLVYVGLRDLQEEEKDFLRERHIKSFDMHDVDRYGIAQVMDWALKILGDRPLHISFDIDALDPREAPSTGTAVRGGLNFREGAYLCEEVHRTGKLVSMELVEVNPTLGSPDDVELTLASGVSMVKAALGETLTHRH